MLGITDAFGLAHQVNSGWYDDLDDVQLTTLVLNSGRMVIEGYKVLRKKGLINRFQFEWKSS